MPIHLQAGDVPLGQGLPFHMNNDVAPNRGFLADSSVDGFRNNASDWGDLIDFSVYGKNVRYFNGVVNTSAGGEKLISTVLGADQLIYIRDTGTAKALDFNGHLLDQAAIDQFFTDLPATTRTATIDVSGNPGAATCDPSIATAKGYNVVN